MSKLTFFHGTMKSGKSMELVKTYTNYQVKNQNPLVLKPSTDSRDTGVIKSRLGVEIPCNYFTNEENIYMRIIDEIGEHNDEIPAVLIDEAQFLSEAQVKNIVEIVDFIEIDVICFGLKTDFMSKLFTGSKTLIEAADKIVEIKTLCSFCNNKATHNLLTKVNDDGERVAVNSIKENNIIIGDKDFYQCCRKCFYNYFERGYKIEDSVKEIK